MTHDLNVDISADPNGSKADPAEILALSLQTMVATVARLARRFRRRAPEDFDELEHALMMCCGAAATLNHARGDQAADKERLLSLLKKLTRRFIDHGSETSRKLKDDKDRGKGDGDGDGDGDGAANPAEPKKKERKSRKGQKYNKQDRSSLEEDRYVVFPEKDRCDCGGALCESDSKDVSKLVMSVRFFKRTHTKKTMRCTSCGTKYKPRARPRLQGKSEFSNELIADVAVNKVLDARPVNRALNIIGRDGSDMSKPAMYRSVNTVGLGLKPLQELIGKDIRQDSDVVSLDETNVKVVIAGDERAVSRGVLVMCRNEKRFGGHRPPAVHYFAPAKKDAASIAAFCAGLGPKVRVIHDGNEAHNEALKHHVDAHCWAHARRPIFEACESRGSPESRLLLTQINSLFEVEKRIHGQKPEFRTLARQEKVLPIARSIQDNVAEQLVSVPQESDYAKALRYIEKRWETLTRYIYDGYLEIDNNLVENAIRTFATTRRISLFAQTEIGAEAWAILATALQTAVMNGCEPKAYKRYVLRNADPRPGYTDWEALLPWNCKDAVAREPATDPTTRYIGRVMTLAEYEASRRNRGDPPLRIAAE